MRTFATIALAGYTAALRLSTKLGADPEQDFQDFIVKQHVSYNDSKDLQEHHDAFIKNEKAMLETESHLHTSTVEVNRLSDATAKDWENLAATKLPTGDDLAQIDAEVAAQYEHTETINGLDVKICIGPCDGSDNGEEEKKDEEEKDEGFPLGRCEHATTCDWREKGATTPVRNQKSCGSCWAFAAIAAVENDYAIKTGVHLDLSEQQSVDCVTYSSNGCNGGNSFGTMKYGAVDRGFPTEADYPYTAAGGSCNTTKPEALKLSGQGYKFTLKQSTQSIIDHLRDGAVVVYLYASDPVFSNYKSGIVTESCTNSTINHAVTAVGFGEDAGQKYFLIKNSWGTWWGDNGYIKLGHADGNGMCGIGFWYSTQATL